MNWPRSTRIEKVTCLMPTAQSILLVGIFLLFVEFFFFEEFKSRFNTVAVDYLWDPHEVFVNIWQSYHVVTVVAVCLVLSLAWVVGLSRVYSRMWERNFSGAARFFYLGTALALLALLAPSLNLKGPSISGDRTLREVANNGLLAFVAAAWTR